jgi:hypothetical protein
MLENFRVGVSLVCIASGVFLIQDSIAGTTDSSQFKLLSGAVLLAVGAIAAWSVTKYRLEWFLRKYRHNHDRLFRKI